MSKRIVKSTSLKDKDGVVKDKKEEQKIDHQEKSKQDDGDDKTSIIKPSELLLYPCYSCFCLNIIGGAAYSILLPDEEILTIQSIAVSALFSIIFLASIILYAIPPEFRKRPLYRLSKNRKPIEHDVLPLDFFIFGVPPSIAMFLLGSSSIYILLELASYFYRYIGVYLIK